MTARLLAFGALAASMAAGAGEFSVHPVRMELGAAARTGVFTIRNEGKERLSFQIQGIDWTQDAEGRDRYTEATDLVYFPRLVAVDGGQEAVVRVGIRQPLVQVEKTYRLFIEELPTPATQPAPGTQVRVLIRFGPPIFVKPLQPVDRIDVEGVRVAAGAVQLTLRNTGNQHQLVESIQLTGHDGGGQRVYTMTLADRYLLAGTAKNYSAAITREQCLAIRRLVTEIKTDKTLAQRQIETQPSMCQ